MKTNETRENPVEHLIAAGYYDKKSVARDMISDLQNYCDANDINFDTEFEIARVRLTLQAEELKDALIAARHALAVAEDEIAIHAEASPEDVATAGVLKTVKKAIADADKFID